MAYDSISSQGYIILSWKTKFQKRSNDYIVGTSDFKKPGLLYAIPTKKQSSDLSILTYDENTKKWSSSGQTAGRCLVGLTQSEEE